MPRQDGKGPDGSGRQGRGLGPCKTNGASDGASNQNQKNGRGTGRCGCGRRGGRRNAQQ